MPASKLKTLALLILLLANLALLALVIPSRTAHAREEKQLRQSLQELYARQQLTLDPDTVPDTATLYTLELAENPAADLRAATALLGEEVLVQDDSTRYLSTYRSAAGRCSISRSGAFEASLTGFGPEDPLQHGVQMLESMGFQIHRHGSPMPGPDGTETLSAMQAVLGVPVFNKGLTLTYRDGSLAAAEGVFFTGTETPTRVSDQACLSAADALVAFLSARFELGWVGSTVTAMEQGYCRSDTAAAAAVHLTPVWRLDTDTGSFYVDGISGQVTPVG